jgi:hypothetical protein
MRKLISAFAALALILSLAACTASPKSSEGCCPMCSSAKAEGKPMKCDKKEHTGGCCEKSGAEGKPAEKHQH